MKLDDDFLLKVTGGEVSFGVIAGIGAAIGFIVSIFEGFFNPRKCNL